MSTSPALSQRALNRGLLDRQHLLTRATMPALDLIEHLVGVQAQAPLAPYVGLWDRLDDFDPVELAELMTSRRTVRATLMRGTIHLVSDRDCLGLRPLLDEMIERRFAGGFSRQLADIDRDLLIRYGREMLEQQPRSRGELRDLLSKRWPEWDADTMAYAVSFMVPAVQITPRGVWGSNGPAALTTVESWLGRPPEPVSVDAVVRRYLAAFGPASVMDAQAWSGLTRLREVFDRLDGLRTFRSETGTVLYDVADAALPSPQTPAPVRYLPEYDNVLISHADRGRVIPEGRRIPLPPGNGAAIGTVLVDGWYQGDWRLRRERGDATIDITPFRVLSPTERDELTDEGARLLAFVAPDDRPRDIRIHQPTGGRD